MREQKKSEVTEYEYNHLLPYLVDYKRFQFRQDRISLGLEYRSQPEDLEDMESTLNVKQMQVLNTKRYFSAANLRAYMFKAYKNALTTYAQQYIRNSEMKYLDPKKLYEFLESHDWDSIPNTTNYKDWDCMSGLTDLEKQVIWYVYRGASYGDLKDMVGYEGSLSGLRNVYDRAKKKFMSNNAFKTLKTRI